MSSSPLFRQSNKALPPEPPIIRITERQTSPITITSSSFHDEEPRSSTTTTDNRPNAELQNHITSLQDGLEESRTEAATLRSERDEARVRAADLKKELDEVLGTGTSGTTRSGDEAQTARAVDWLAGGPQGEVLETLKTIVALANKMVKVAKAAEKTVQGESG